MHWLECVGERIFFDADQKAGSEKEGDLFARNLVFTLHGHHLQHDEEVSFIGLDLGPLPQVEHVLERERVKPETISKRL